MGAEEKCVGKVGKGLRMESRDGTLKVEDNQRLQGVPRNMTVCELV